MTNQFEDAAQILRDLKDRVSNLEEQRSQSGSVNVFRSDPEASLGADTVTVTIDEAGGWTYGTSAYDKDEWE